MNLKKKSGTFKSCNGISTVCSAVLSTAELIKLAVFVCMKDSILPDVVRGSRHVAALQEQKYNEHIVVEAASLSSESVLRSSPLLTHRMLFLPLKYVLFNINQGKNNNNICLLCCVHTEKLLTRVCSCE